MARPALSVLAPSPGAKIVCWSIGRRNEVASRTTVRIKTASHASRVTSVAKKNFRPAPFTRCIEK